MEVNQKLTEKALRDCELVRLALEKGDQKAYADLMNNYRDSLYYMLLKMTNDATDAEDLTIEAFGKAFKNLDNYTPEYAFSTWLFKIATNNCIDFIRKKKRMNFAVSKSYDNENEPQEIAKNLPSGSLDPEEKFIESQKIKLMRDVVEKLKPHYRRLVELRYFSEYSYEEISVEMNLPIGTVKAQLFRAREFLYNILKNSEGKI
jgi:RNA polymerase sigma-70 factor (ECF subfamily)